MIEKAKLDYPKHKWIIADAMNYESTMKFDIIFSNATIQWIPDHKTLLKRFSKMLSANGLLAIQLPKFQDMAIGRIFQSVSQNKRWKKEIGDCSKLFTYHDFHYYYDLLANNMKSIDMWETDYIHIFPSPLSIVEWTKSTAMRPYLSRITNDAGKKAFEQDILTEVTKCYPKQKKTGKYCFHSKDSFLSPINDSCYVGAHCSEHSEDTSHLLKPAAADKCAASSCRAPAARWRNCIYAMTENIITPLKATLIFFISTLYFILLLLLLLPLLKSHLSVNPALFWFITGYCLFTPLLAYALITARQEGNKGIKQILLSLNIKTLTKTDLKYSVIGLFVVFISTGFIFGISILLNKYFKFRPLTTTPWFMEIHTFQGSDIFLLLIWLPMFFLNIFGEELLWRGYIQSRLQGKYSWLLCSVLWLLFHLPFGMDLMIMLLPVIIIIPYAFYKTQNTLVGVFIHGIYNGPIFVAVALGWIK